MPPSEETCSRGESGSHRYLSVRTSKEPGCLHFMMLILFFFPQEYLLVKDSEILAKINE